MFQNSLSSAYVQMSSIFAHWVDWQATRVPTASNLRVGVVTEEEAAAADEVADADEVTTTADEVAAAADEVTVVDLEATTDATTSEMGIRPVVVD